MDGYIKLFRKTLSSDVFRDPDLLKLWVYSLSKASHIDRIIEFEGELVAIEKGQYITGRKVLTKEYNEKVPPKKVVPDTTLWNWLKKLEKMGNIKIESAPSRKYSIVTISKWVDYQINENMERVITQPKAEGSDDMSEFIQAGEELAATDSPVKGKTPKRIYVKGEVEYDLSARLFYWMLKNNPNAKKPDPQKWADSFRLIIERDKRDPEEIKSLIDWSQNHDFWMGNILSPDKLRKQYDTLFIQRKVESEKKETIHRGGRGAGKNALLREMMDEEVRKNGKVGNDKTLFIDN